MIFKRHKHTILILITTLASLAALVSCQSGDLPTEPTAILELPAASISPPPAHTPSLTPTLAASATAVPLPDWFTTPQPAGEVYYGGGDQWLLLYEYFDLHNVMALRDETILVVGSLVLDPGITVASWVARHAPDGSLLWQRLIEDIRITQAYQTSDETLVLVSNVAAVHLNLEGEFLHQASTGAVTSYGSSLSPDPLWIQSGTQGGALLYSPIGHINWLQPDGLVSRRTVLDLEPAPEDALTWILRNGALSAQSLGSELRIERQGLQTRVWSVTLASEMENLVSITPLFLRGTQSGGAFLAAKLDPLGEDEFIWLVQLHPSGKMLWETSLALSPPDHVIAIELEKGEWLLGLTIEQAGGSELQLLRTSPTGDLEWLSSLYHPETILKLQSAEQLSGGDLLLGFSLTDPKVGVERPIMSGLARITAQGNLQECSWVQRGQTLVEPQINMNQTLISRENLELTQVDVEGVPPLNIVLRPGYLPIEQACVFPRLDPTTTPTPTPTLDLSRLAGKPVYPILNNNGVVIGGVQQGGQWFEPQYAAWPITRGDNIAYAYRMNGGVYGPSQLSPYGANIDCQGNPRYQVSPRFDPRPDLIANLPWDVFPRTPEALVTDNATYQSLIDEILRERGLRDPQVEISKILKVDLDGNGFDEVLIEARKSSSDPLEAYSIIVLRKVIDQAAHSIVLRDTVSPVQPYSSEDTYYEIGGAYDLDGDGILEILIHANPSQQYSLVYDIVNGEVKHVLGEACP